MLRSVFHDHKVKLVFFLSFSLSYHTSFSYLSLFPIMHLFLLHLCFIYFRFERLPKIAFKIVIYNILCLETLINFMHLMYVSLASIAIHTGPAEALEFD